MAGRQAILHNRSLVTKLRRAHVGAGIEACCCDGVYRLLSCVDDSDTTYRIFLTADEATALLTKTIRVKLDGGVCTYLDPTPGDYPGNLLTGPTQYDVIDGDCSVCCAGWATDDPSTALFSTGLEFAEDPGNVHTVAEIINRGSGVFIDVTAPFLIWDNGLAPGSPGYIAYTGVDIFLNYNNPLEPGEPDLNCGWGLYFNVIRTQSAVGGGAETCTYEYLSRRYASSAIGDYFAALHLYASGCDAGSTPPTVIVSSLAVS